MIGPKEQGGLDMPDFDIINNALKATWVKRLNDSSETSSWSHIPLYYLQDVGGLTLTKRLVQRIIKQLSCSKKKIAATT